ncbi:MULTISPECIES: hypothetical protein [Pseudomonas]|uniref:Uncharacterized protein n=1 Tax=Pseudomonas fluorescens TaxID=294 RepID=A0A109LAZ3_PSEFL|nr:MULTISPECIES: hypothetical protein [Pseudomonas]KWV84181.1 hypothetical protein PFL603g_00279 [Pseudomonas fluorescens]
MNIDWSKAPAWAVGHALHAFGGEIREVWVGEHQYQRLDQPKPFPYGGGNSDHRHNPRRSEFHFEQLRPAPWTGKGLPPVGAVCEYRCGYVEQPYSYAECTVIAHFVGESGKSLAAFAYVAHDGVVQLGRGMAELFRPIRTPEQVAAEDRDKAIEGMIADTNILTGIMSDRRIMAGQLYDAGYRKQASP